MAFKKVKCRLCLREIGINSFGLHVASHRNIKLRLRKKRVAWNKDLTKKTDARLIKFGESLSKSMKSGKKKLWQTGLTKESSDKIRRLAESVSRSVQEKVKNGEWHNGIKKKVLYQDIWFDSSLEVLYAKYLNTNNIRWRRPVESFEYFFDEKTRRYTPDFYLPDENVYVEIKGVLREKDNAKFSQFTQALRVLRRPDVIKLHNSMVEYPAFNRKARVRFSVGEHAYVGFRLYHRQRPHEATS